MAGWKNIKPISNSRGFMFPEMKKKIDNINEIIKQAEELQRIFAEESYQLYCALTNPVEIEYRELHQKYQLLQIDYLSYKEAMKEVSIKLATTRETARLDAERRDKENKAKVMEFINNALTNLAVPGRELFKGGVFL